MNTPFETKEDAKKYLQQFKTKGISQADIKAYKGQRKYKTADNQMFFIRRGEVNNLPSMTVPDQDMSPEEIVRRVALGIPVNGAKVPMYEGEESPFAGVDFTRMDLAEREQLLKDAKAFYDQTISDIRKQQQEAEKKKHMENKEKEFQDRLKKELGLKNYQFQQLIQQQQKDDKADDNK